MPRRITTWTRPPGENCSCVIHINHETDPPTVIRGGTQIVVDSEVQISWQDAAGNKYALNDATFINSPDLGPCLVVRDADGTFKATLVTPVMQTVLRNHMMTGDKKCPFHRHLDDAAWLAEMQRENAMPGLARELAGGVLATVTEEHFKATFDLQRRLVISFDGLQVGEAQKALMRSRCDAQFGPGKVLVS